MKRNKLILSNLIGLYKESKVAFRFLIFSILFTSLFLIYMYGNFLPSKVLRAINSPDTRIITVNVGDEDMIDEEALHILDDYNIAEVCVSYTTDYMIPFLGKNLTLSAYRDNNEKGEYLNGEAVFTEQEKEEGKIILSVDHSDVPIELNGVKYQICRHMQFLSVDYAIVPISKMLSSEGKIDTVEYLFSDYSFYHRIGDITNKLKSKYHLSTIVGPPDSMDVIMNGNVKVVFIMIIVLVICFILNCMILEYLFNKNAEKYKIYKLAGCSNYNLFFHLLEQNTIIYSSEFLLTAIIHFAFYSYIDKWFNFVEGICYSISDYILLAFVFIISSILVNMFFINRFIAKIS